MSEPVIDLSEIVDLYKEDVRLMIVKMRAAIDRWEEVQNGGPARSELRRMSHQLRGSGRTYGFRQVTRFCKAIENTVILLEKERLTADDRVRESLGKKLMLLHSSFSVS